MSKFYFILSFSFLIFCSKLSSQTYYGYQARDTDSYVNYAEIAQDLSAQLKYNAEKRQEMRKYYENLYHNTKNNINSLIQLTGDYKINQLINNLNAAILNSIDNEYVLLTSGINSPNKFESNLKSWTFNFKYFNNTLKQLELLKANLKPNENDFFYKLLNHVEGFSINKGVFELTGIEFTGSKNISQITDYFNYYIHNRNQYDFDVKKFENKKKLLEEQKRKKLLEEEKIREEVYNRHRKIISKRDEMLSSFTYKEKQKYLKKELKYVSKRIYSVVLKSEFSTINLRRFALELKYMNDSNKRYGPMKVFDLIEEFYEKNK